MQAGSLDLIFQLCFPLTKPLLCPLPRPLWNVHRPQGTLGNAAQLRVHGLFSIWGQAGEEP